MQIDVPIISETDVLIAGGTLAACSLALRLAEKGYSVYLATRFCHLGEDYCGTFDFSKSQLPEYALLTGDSAVRMPGELKAHLESKLLETGVEYLYQSYPITVAEDQDGRICGLVIANRSGFQLIRARVIIDATEHAIALKASGIPCREITAGKHKIMLNVIGQPGMDAELLPFDAIDGAERFPVYRCTREIEIKADSISELMTHEMNMRRAVIHENLRRQANFCEFDFPEKTIVPTPQLPVMRIGNADLNSVKRLLSKCPTTTPVRFRKQGESGMEIVRKDSCPRFENLSSLPFELNTLPMIGDCDIAVAGGGTGGAAAAIGAAREKCNVICTELMNLPGGVSTVGRIQGYWHGVPVGFTEELNRTVLNFGKPYGVEPGCHEDLHIFPKEWRAWCLLEESEKAGVHFWFNTLAVAAGIAGNKLCGVAVATPYGCGCIAAKTVIDSTGAADIAAAAGGKILESTNEPVIQGAAIPPDLPSKSHSNNDFQFILDNDIFDLTRAFTMAHAVLRKHFDSVGIPGTRERRSCLGDVVVQPYDIFAGTRWPDAVSLARSNFDMHGYAVHPLLLMKTPEQKDIQAEVPWGALLPAGLENIMVTGLAISAHRDALPILRMQADVQNQGYAVGLGSAMSLHTGTSPRKIDIKLLQKRLREKGILADWNFEFNTLSDIAAIFRDPETRISALEHDFSENACLETAVLLAFLGSGIGKKRIAKAIRLQKWDAGWDFRGMYQQRTRCSNSPLDCLLFALANTTGDTEAVLEKCRRLEKDAEFSHIRAVCMYFMKHPDRRAVPELERMLRENGCHAVRTLKDAANPVSSDENDNTVRNLQLKELYLARALRACDSGLYLAEKSLSDYRTSLHGHYARFAR